VTLNDWLERRRAVQDVLAELTIWTPREREGAFRSWLRRSFSLVHLHVLTLLETSGPMSITALAESLDVSVAAVTGIVDRMEERRLVERRPGPGDRRVVLVHPTRRGTGLFRALGRQRRAALAPILERMTDEEIAATLTGLRAMRRVRAELLVPDPPANEPEGAP
jgi:DNA-binding MarR family transcriptional regulator